MSQNLAIIMLGIGQISIAFVIYIQQRTIRHNSDRMDIQSERLTSLYDHTMRMEARITSLEQQVFSIRNNRFIS